MGDKKILLFGEDQDRDAADGIALTYSRPASDFGMIT
jgi:hypothetical protein